MIKRKVFERKIYKKILEWKNSPIHNSALLIEGARRVGKSTIAEEFAKNEFAGNYIIVDFRKESEQFKKLFEDIKDLNSFFSKFFLFQNKTLKPGGLIIFDEIQFCPKARESIKDLVADGRFYYLETGSLISIKENVKDIMIPSEERRIDMFPMDFEEFLWATENNNAFKLLGEYFDNKEKIPEAIHKQYLEKFRTYMIIGGMPKVLSIFLETNSFELANDEKLDILKLYKDDLRKHDNKYKTVCESIFDSIPSQLAKENKRFVINKINNKKRFEQIKKSLDDLCEFKIVNKVNALSTLESPISMNSKDDKFKLYFCDTGLLFTKLIDIAGEKMNETYLKFIEGRKVLNLGSIFESIAVQQLVSIGIKPFFHKFDIIESENAKTYELDLVFERNLKVNILEVKSSKNYTTSSINNIKNKYPQLKLNKSVFGIKNISSDAIKTTYPIYLINQI